VKGLGLGAYHEDGDDLESSISLLVNVILPIKTTQTIYGNPRQHPREKILQRFTLAEQNEKYSI
jgi:hypothetical protein